MKHKRAIFTLLLSVGFVGAIETWAAEKIVLTGSSTIAPLALEIAKKFEAEQKDVRVDVQTGGSSRGVNDARTGLAQIGMASRALGESEKDLVSFKIAVDGVAPVVHSSNKVSNLSDDQFKNIFTGVITNWKQVGGADAPIVVVNRAEGRSELKMFAKRSGISVSDIKAAMIVGENAHAVKTIAGNKNAITYISVGHTLKEMSFGVPVKALALNGVAATFKNVANGTYAFARPLNLVVRPGVSGLSKQFIDYAMSNKVIPLIESQSFVPVTH